jgi:hypothetical protein
MKRLSKQKTPALPNKPASKMEPAPTSSSASLKFDTPEIRVGLNAVKPYTPPKESTAANKLKSTEKHIKMPGKPDRNPARKSARKASDK